ncbi:MAG: DR2241 family protein [Haloarculaceae archaeon]
MSERSVERLLSALEDGPVQCDGLRAERDADGYAFRTPTVDERGLTAARFRAVASENRPYVRNWDFWTRVAPTAPARRAFLRWLERAADRTVPERYDALAAGAHRQWGQLLVTAELDADGQRTYEVRHVDDADRDPAALERYDEPREARELARLDADGRYRPLKTAPTLRSGWVFPDLGPGELVATVDFSYPATVANWHRECAGERSEPADQSNGDYGAVSRAGDLDVTHYREAAARQTGIYDVVDELDRGAVRRLAAACCVDSQCLKRREWDFDDGEALDVSRGDGEFPCREPCSLVIAAARAFRELEWDDGDAERAVGDDRLAELEALVDAVADGEAGAVREADFEAPANRYRVRYLREKLRDEGAFDGDRSNE